MEFKTEGIIFMISAIVIILALFIYTLSRVLRSDSKK